MKGRKKKNMLQGGAGEDYPVGDLNAYYRFNSDSTDEVGTEDGTDTNMSYVSGKSGNAADFNGTNGYITIVGGSQSVFRFSDGLGNDLPFSFTCFVSFDVKKSSWFFATFDSSSDRAYIFAYNNTDLTILIGNNLMSAYIRANYTWTPSTSTWYHLAVTYDGNELDSGLKLYLDGSLLTTTNSTTGTYTGMGTSVTEPVFGRNAAGAGSDYLNGQIDGFGVWGKELTADEITAIYNKQNGGDELI